MWDKLKGTVSDQTGPSTQSQMVELRDIVYSWVLMSLEIKDVEYELVNLAVFILPEVLSSCRIATAFK